MTGESPEMVWISSSNAGAECYHTERECPYLHNASGVRDVARKQIEDRRDMCKGCADEEDDKAHSDLSYLFAALKAGGDRD